MAENNPTTTTSNSSISFETWSDEQFAAWLAGFFDGEGCVYIPEKTGIALSISNTVRDVIFAIRNRLQIGTITETTFSNMNWRTKYSWQVKTYKEAGAFLKLIRPFLTIKAAKADEAMARIEASQARFRTRYERNKKMIELVESGMTHKDVAALFNNKSLLCNSNHVCASQGLLATTTGRAFQ